MIAFGSAITKPEVYRRCAEPGIRRAAEPDSEVLALQSVGSIFRSYNARARRPPRPRRPRGARARAPGRRDRRCGLLRRRCVDALQRPATVGVVGCVGAIGVRSIAWWEGSVDARVVHPPLRRARRRRPAGVLVGVDRRAAVRAHRRGRHARRLPARAVAVGGPRAPLRRVARPAARLRLRLLPAGPRRGPQGRHRRLPRDPPPRARAVQRPGGVDRGAHARRREVGRARCRASAPARAPGRSARCAPRPSATPRALAGHTNALRRRGARPRARARAWRRPASSISWRITAPLRRLRLRDDRLRRRHRASRSPTTATPSRASGAPPSRTPRSIAVRRRRPVRAQLQPAARRRRAARRPRGARARRTRTPRSPTRLLREGARRAARSRRRRRRLRRGAAACARIAWWEGEVTAAPVVHRYPEHGGGEVPGFAWAAPAAAGPARSTRVDGFLLVLSPWAVRTLRFDEALRLDLGYDVDFCRQVREAGRKVVAADLRVDPSPRRSSWSANVDVWVEAHMQFAEKWDGDERPAGLGAPRPPRGGRARGGARHRPTRRLLAARRPRGASSSARSPRRPGRSAGALTEPLRRLNRLRRELAPLVAVERAADLVLGDDRHPPGAIPRAHAAAGTAARRRAKALESSRRRSTASWRAGALLRPPGLDLPLRAPARGDGRGWPRAASSSALRSHGLEDPGDRVGPRRVRRARRRRSRRTPARPPAAGPSRAATKSSTAVSTPLRGPPSRAAERG